MTVLDELRVKISNIAMAIKVANKKDHGDLLTEQDFLDAQEQALAINFIKGVHPKYKKENLVHLRKCKLQGNNYYPKTIAEAYNTMSRWGMHGTAVSTGPDGGAGVAFMNKGQNGKSKKMIKCFNCGKEEHNANQCSIYSKTNGNEDSEGENDRNQGTAVCMTGVKSQHNTSEANDSPAFSFSQTKTCILKQLILLDNQPTIDLFCNHEFLTNV